MAETEKMYGELSQERLDEITEKIEMKWEESLFGIITFLDELSPEERISFLNMVGQSKGRVVRFPQDVNDVIDFSVKYLASRGVDVSKRPGLQILNSGYTNQGMYDRVNAIIEGHKHGGR